MMDESWLHSAEEGMWDLLGVSEGWATGHWVLLGAALVTLVLVFARISRMGDTAGNGPIVSLLAVGVGVGCLVGSWLLVSGWLVPLTGMRIPATAVRAAAVVLSLVLAVPLMSLILRAHVYSMLFAWGGGLLAALLLMWFGRMGLDLIASGSSNAERTKARSTEMQEFLNDQ